MHVLTLDGQDGTNLLAGWLAGWLASVIRLTLLCPCNCAPQVCECVVILRGLKDVSWAGAKSMMADGSFLRTLLEFDKDGLTDKQASGRATYIHARV